LRPGDVIDLRTGVSTVVELRGIAAHWELTVRLPDGAVRTVSCTAGMRFYRSLA
jgi:hypothetical protein